MRNAVLALMAGTALAATASAQVTVGVGQSGAGWLGYMNVFDLGGFYAFGSPWGVPDLNTSFNDGARTLTLSPNTIGDPNPYWYLPSGGPGSSGNKIMEANLYQEFTGPYAGQTLSFQGVVLSNTFTSAHRTYAFIKDFAPDYSSNVAQVIELTAPGAFSLSLATVNDPSRHVQFGFMTVGVNVWATDTAPFGNMVIQTLPTPGAVAMLGLAGVVAGRRRRR
ncbi:MAG: hypothetical protein WCK33_09020 [Phycisphaerae bacterium]